MPVIQGAPAISGTAEPGGTLTCAAPAVDSPDGPATTALAWLRDGAPAGHRLDLRRWRRGRWAHAVLPHHGDERRRRCERDERRRGRARVLPSGSRRRPAAAAASAASERRRGPPPPPQPPAIARVATGPLTLSARSRRGVITVTGRLGLPRGARCQGTDRDRREARQDPRREQEHHPAHPLRSPAGTGRRSVRAAFAGTPSSASEPALPAPPPCFRGRPPHGRSASDRSGSLASNMPPAPTERASADAPGVGERALAWEG